VSDTANTTQIIQQKYNNNYYYYDKSLDAWDIAGKEKAGNV